MPFGKVDGIFTIKDQRNAMTAFLSGEEFYRIAEGYAHLELPLVPIGSLEPFQPGSTGNENSHWSALNVIDRVVCPVTLQVIYSFIFL